MAKIKKSTLIFAAALGSMFFLSSNKENDPLIIEDWYNNWILTRSTVSTYPTRQLSQIKRIVVHHAAAQNQTAVDYARYHVGSNGWPGIGYHYVIEKNGRVIQGNPLENISYHVGAGENTPSIGICLSGNFDIEHPTPIQLKRLEQLIKKLRQDLPQALEINGHRDFKNKSCPGDNLYPLIQKYKLA